MNEIDILILKNINITRTHNDEELKEVTLRVITMAEKIITSKSFEIKGNIRGVIGDMLYIFKECQVQSYDISIGDCDEVTEAEITMLCKVNEIDTNIKFTDKIHKVAPLDLCLFEDEYGNPQNISYDEFCQKCLAVKI